MTGESWENPNIVPPTEMDGAEGAVALDVFAVGELTSVPVEVGAIGSERVLVGPGEGGATLVPALLLEQWAFTGQTG